MQRWPRTRTRWSGNSRRCTISGRTWISAWSSWCWRSPISSPISRLRGPVWPPCPPRPSGCLILVRSRGLGWAELGLSREHWKSGAGYALAAVAVVMSVIAIGALLPWTRPMFMNNNYATDVGRIDRVDDHHPAADGHPRGAGLPRCAARRAESGVGLPRRRCRRFVAVRPVAHRHLTGPDQQQCRVHADPRWRVCSAPWPVSCWRWRPPRWPASSSPGCADAAAA